MLVVYSENILFGFKLPPLRKFDPARHNAVFLKLFDTMDHSENFWWVADHLNILDFIFTYKRGSSFKK